MEKLYLLQQSHLVFIFFCGETPTKDCARQISVCFGGVCRTSVVTRRLHSEQWEEDVGFCLSNKGWLAEIIQMISEQVGFFFCFFGSLPESVLLWAAVLRLLVFTYAEDPAVLSAPLTRQSN